MSNFFARFAPTDTVEFRLIRPGERGAKRFWHQVRHVGNFLPVAETMNRGGYEIFCTVNAVQFGKSGRESLTRAVSAHVDVDGPLPKPWPADVPQPSQIVASGAGSHCYWWIEPTEDFKAVERINMGLAQRLSNGDDHCWDASRVLRVPGFQSHKRGGIEVTICDFKGIRYTLGELRLLAVESLPDRALRAKTPQVGASTDPPSPFLLDKLKHAARRDAGLRAALLGETGDGASDARYAAVRRLAAHGFADTDIASLICSRRWFNRRSHQYSPAWRVSRDVERLLASVRF